MSLCFLNWPTLASFFFFRSCQQQFHRKIVDYSTATTHYWVFDQNLLVFSQLCIAHLDRHHLGAPNVIEIEGLLFPGFGQTQGCKFFTSSDVTRALMRALKMELFSCKFLNTLMCMMSLDGKNRFFCWKVCAPAFAQIPGIANLIFQ